MQAHSLTMRTMWSHGDGMSTLKATASLAFACLAGCASQIEVEAEFPTPLVEALPVTVGIILDEALTQYEHFEEIPDQITWTISLGDANVQMLEQLFDTLFATTVRVDAIPPTDATIPLDGIIRPELERFEFEVPVRGRDNFAEVWMQYQLRLYEPDGDLVIEWPVSGYGKSEIRRSRREDSLNQAAIVAMREVGAAIATQFSTQPQVAYWLEERQNLLQSARNPPFIEDDDTSLITPDTAAGTNDD
jgi:hypothetical protein